MGPFLNILPSLSSQELLVPALNGILFLDSCALVGYALLFSYNLPDFPQPTIKNKTVQQKLFFLLILETLPLNTVPNKKAWLLSLKKKKKKKV